MMACVTLKRSLDFDPLYSPNRPNKRRRCIPIHATPTPEKKSRDEESHKPSSFLESQLSPEQIANNLRDEIKRMKKRRQIVGWPREPASPGGGSAPSSPEPMMDTELPSTSYSSLAATDSSLAAPDSSLAATGGKEKPIFTLKQMTLIAERMCQERVDQVRQEYDEILQQKLSEQYESFVKFIDQQIQRRFTESHAPSYLS